MKPYLTNLDDALVIRDEFSYQTCSFGAKNVRPVRSWNSPTWSWPPVDWTRHTLATSAISIFHQTGKFPNQRYCGTNITLKTKKIWKNTSPHHLSKKCIIYIYTPISFFVKKLSNDLNTNNSTGPRKPKIPIILVGRSFLQINFKLNLKLPPFWSPDMTKLLEDRKHGISSALEPWIARASVFMVVLLWDTVGGTCGWWMAGMVCGSCIIYKYTCIYICILYDYE